MASRKPSPLLFDVIVIGSGSAGFSAAEVARSLGASVALIESGALGGECPTWACVPTKALLKSAVVYHKAKYELASFGVHARSVSYNFAEIMARKRSVVRIITGDGKRLERAAKQLGIKIFRGQASFTGAKTIRVEQLVLRGRAFVIATGSRDVVPPIEGLEEAGYMGFRDVVSLKAKPASVCIIGAGPVGCEFATFFSLLSTRVVLLQLSDRILDREDPEISALAVGELRKRGAQVFTRARALRIEKVGKKRKVVFQVGKKAREHVVVDQVILAAGKRAHIDALAIDQAQVNLDGNGWVHVSEALQTNQKHIFAAGDVSGGYLFTHTAHEEGVVAGWNAAFVAKKKRGALQKRDQRVVPRVTFVHPEIASVGMTSQEAVEKKYAVHISSFPVGALARSVTEGARGGMIKIVINQKTDQILGAHMIGERAGEVMHEVALAIYAKIPAQKLAKMIHAFPTFSEVIPAALFDL